MSSSAAASLSASRSPSPPQTAPTASSVAPPANTASRRLMERLGPANVLPIVPPMCLDALGPLGPLLLAGALWRARMVPARCPGFPGEHLRPAREVGGLDAPEGPLHVEARASGDPAAMTGAGVGAEAEVARDAPTRRR